MIDDDSKSQQSNGWTVATTNQNRLKHSGPSVLSRMEQRRPYVTRVVDIDTDTTISHSLTHAF
jgi:hypothetical protein